MDQTTSDDSARRRTRLRTTERRSWFTGAAAGAVAWLLPVVWRGFATDVLARGAAWLTSFFTGSPVVRVEDGWALPASAVPVVVTAACSAADYYWMVAGLAAWQLVRRGCRPSAAIIVAVTSALPVTVGVNSLRIVAVAQAHRWANAMLPPSYDAALHLAVGVAVFLPSLLALNFALEHHGRSCSLRSR